MRLLELDPQVQSFLVQDRISVGHAKVLLSLKAHEQQVLLAEEIIRRHLTVRGAETLVAQHFEQAGAVKPTRGPASGPVKLAPAIHRLQNRLQQHLATHVVLHHAEKKGRIEIDYYGNDDLQRLLLLLGLPDEES